MKACSRGRTWHGRLQQPFLMLLALSPDQLVVRLSWTNTSEKWHVSGRQ